MHRLDVGAELGFFDTFDKWIANARLYLLNTELMLLQYALLG